MAWSFEVAKPAGISVRVHATFFLLLLWASGSVLADGQGLLSALQSALWIASVFVIVVLHELGHALAARRYGIGTKDILLLPIGGVASLERMPENPRQEVVVALAGPAVNVVLLFAFAGVASILGHSLPAVDPESIDPMAIPWTIQLMAVNFMLAAFNLLPAFPMDGGRVLRGLLATRMPRARATRIAARIGKVFAVGLGMVGLWANPVLVLIAVFVWFGGEAEARQTQLESDFRDTHLASVAVVDVRSFDVREPLDNAVRAVVDTTQADFPIRNGQQWVGVLTREGLIRGLAEAGPNARIADHFEADAPQLDGSLILPEALRQMQRHRVALVMDGPRLVGLFDHTQLAELVALRKALDGNAAQRALRPAVV